ncbi:MAG: PQQ-like beta-propeller repeat protein, partial [Actinomycetota bacterium]|nr:PQQ-like beta-propeller repeat protein [Actinomycetota bacterium]
MVITTQRRVTTSVRALRPAMRGLAVLGVVGLGVLGLGRPAAATSTWPTYHADPARSGADPAEAPLSPLSPAWSNRLDGTASYGQPVVADGRVFAATEGDGVFALDPHNGRALWQASIGTPLTGVSAAVGCGNIDPLGITSTPVLDTAAHVLYVVGEVASGGHPPIHHQLVGFNTLTGAVVSSANADPPVNLPNEDLHLQQRGALALANGRVYVAYGGFAGDCGHYHGWVVGIDPGGARPAVSFDVSADGEGGAVWEA